MLKCKLSIRSIAAARKIFTSSSVSNEIQEPKKQFDQEVPSSKPLSDYHLKRIEDDKRRLNWRKSLQDDPAFYKSKLDVFNDDEKAPSALEAVAQPIDFSLRGLKKYITDYNIRKERFLQQFIPERHEILGNDLAAAHFILFRQGRVKFVGEREYMYIGEDMPFDIPLPKSYDPKYEVEEIKCEGMELFYEGLENIRRLKKLKYLSFRNVKLFDDWGLDRVSGSEYIQLETLDVTGTAVTANGLQALYRMPSLKKFIADEQPEDNVKWHLTVAMLNDIMPDLKVISSASESK